MTKPPTAEKPKAEKPSSTALDKIEQFSRIFATVLVPVIVAIGGWILQTTVEHDKQQAAIVQATQQQTLEQQRVSLEYVKIAKEILTNTKAAPTELTRWSWLLLNDVSPTKFAPDDLKKLIERNDKIPAPPNLAPARPSGPGNLDGFVIYVNRARTDRRSDKSFARTVGSYYVTYEGERLPGLEGATVEREGPGDNSTNGVLAHRRLQAGAYPLSTAGGDRFRTINFAESDALEVRPWPAIRVQDTGNRAGILIHPAAGFLMAVGTINLSRPLNGPADDIDFQDSRARMIALISGMRAKIGASFPSSNETRIDNAWLVIADEPDNSAAN